MIAKTCSVSMRKASWPYGLSMTASSRQAGAVATTSPSAGVKRRSLDTTATVSSAVIRRSASATPPRSRPTSWLFMASVRVR
ncbi:hypothetical protein BJF86_03260 [Serinicoccus sp. CNJ-927]|nr:hypothetical protein BJF86_03260 [Serinicoccus sp. CNJ-927]